MAAGLMGGQSDRWGAPGSDRAPRPWRPVLAVSAAATVLALAAALAGTRAVEPAVPAWPRFWATAYFVVLLWPVGLGLAGRLAGVRAQVAAAAVLLAATVAQQAGLGAMPVPLITRWYATLAVPGEAIRHRIALPEPQDRAWQRAWQRAVRVALVICTGEAVATEAGVTVAVNGEPPISLAALPRRGDPQGWGWYHVPLTLQNVGGARQLEALVRREGAEGAPAVFCGGPDDPTRPGWGGSARWLDGRWVPDRLADPPVPSAAVRPAPGRYFMELRFYDAAGLPSVGIWY
jgi:hypothetical protein